MVSRRKILSRSRDDLNLDQTFSPAEEEEDVWYQREKLYKEHIQEVLDKWTQIDDEIWAKVIVFERNRRVAKAYARAPVLTINGSDDGFDGMRIGLCGFDNPMRDQKTDEYKRHIGQGVKIKMDDAGNILVRRYAKSNVYIKSTATSPNEETSIGADILKLPNQALESEKIVKLFDMKKFQSNVNRELRRAYPDRRRLETQCLSLVAFVRSENDILECPIWVLIVNVVAMDMLKSKLPPVQRPVVDIKNRPRIPIPDEDPYSVAGNGSGGSSGSSGFGAGSSSGHHQQQQQQQQHIAAGMGVALHGMNGNGVGGGINGGTAVSGHVAATREQLLLQTQQLAHKRSEKPPKLPPRDNIYAHDIIPKPDYDDIEVDNRIKLSRGKSDKGKDNKKYDDPYYCGLRARVPNFVKTTKPSKDHKEHTTNGGTVNGSVGHTNGHSNGSNMNTLSQKKNSMLHMSMTAPNLQHAMHVAPTPPPHMHPLHIQQQQLMAAAAAQAVHHHHPAAAAAAHHQHHLPQHPVWQARSYESGIGIYSSSSSGGCQQQLNAATANYLMDQHNNSNNNNSNNSMNQMSQAQATTLQAQAQAQVQVQQTQQLHSALPQLLSAAAAHRVPVDAVFGMDGHGQILNQNNNNKKNHNSNIQFNIQQHEQLQQQWQQAHQRHHHHPQQENEQRDHSHSRNHNSNRHNHRHHSRNCTRRQAPTGMRGCYAPLPVTPSSAKFHLTDSDYPDPDLVYGGTQSPLLSPNERSSRSRFRRISRELQQALSPHRLRTSRTRRDTSSAVGSNCNCVSCYTLAPLFGIVQPARPPRSLSQQQLRLHQQLSGSLADIPPPPPPPPLPAALAHTSNYTNIADAGTRNGGKVVRSDVDSGGRLPKRDNTLCGGKLVKWCSESDISLVNQRRSRYVAPSDTYTYDEGFDEADADADEGNIADNIYAVGGARDNECLYALESDGASRYTNDFDLECLDYVPHSSVHRAQPQRVEKNSRSASNKKKSYNEYAMQTRQHDDACAYTDDTDWDVLHSDRYTTNRLRQLCSPPPPQPPSEGNYAGVPKPGGRVQDATRVGRVQSPPALLRHKSLSIESFFEQPNEEGTLYMYGGRKRIIKSPSTANLYDRLRHSNTNNIARLAASDMKTKARTTSGSSKCNNNEGDEKARLRNLQEKELLHFQRHKLGLHMPKKHNATVAPPLPTKTTTSAASSSAALLEEPKLPPPCWRRRKNSNCSGSTATVASAATETIALATKPTNDAPPATGKAIKQMSGSIVAATTAAFEMKVHNQKRSQTQAKQKQEAELIKWKIQKQKQQQKLQQKYQQHLNNCGQTAKLPNESLEAAQAQRVANFTQKTPKKHKRNSSESGNFLFNNNNIVKNNTNAKLNSANPSALLQMPVAAIYDAAQQQTKHTRQQNQQQHGRLSRPTSRVDVSDMDSIYGYLKPRKPRSLSLKKIQILDY